MLFISSNICSFIYLLLSRNSSLFFINSFTYSTRPSGVVFSVTMFSNVCREIACRVKKLKQEVDSRDPLFGHEPPPARPSNRKSLLRHTITIEGSPTDARCKLWQSVYAVPTDFITPNGFYLPPHENELQWST